MVPADTAFVALAIVACVSVVLLSVLAVMRERRVGLRPSYLRLGLVAAVLAFETLVAIVVRSSAEPGLSSRAEPVQGSQESAPEGPPSPILTALQKRRAELITQLDEVDSQIHRMQPRALRALEPPPIPSMSETTRIVLLSFLLLFGVVALFIGGPLDTVPLLDRIVGRGRRGEVNSAAKATGTILDALAAAASQGHFEQGLEHADELQDRDLSRLDRLDGLFLGSFCAVRLALGGKPAATSERRAELLARATRDLSRALAEAPEMAEAMYLLAFAQMSQGARDAENYEPALQGFRKAKERIKSRDDLPFEYNESTCLLGIAEKLLQSGDMEGANRAFQEVTRYGVLAEEVPLTLVSEGLREVRNAILNSRSAEARKRLESLRQLSGLAEDKKKKVLLVCSAYEVLAIFREGNDAETEVRVTAFLREITPPSMPEVEDFTADEYLFAAVEADALTLRPDLVRVLYFLLAIVRVRSIRTRGRGLADAQLVGLSQPLLRALQFEPRQRDVLASLGGLYYYFAPGKRLKALEWLRAAITMGVRSAIAQRIVERDTSREIERRDILERFLGASSRFLVDPTLSRQVRRALVAELGTFQEFRPLLVEAGPLPESEGQGPTLPALRERAKYVAAMAEEVSKSKLGPNAALAKAQKDYMRVVAELERNVTSLNELQAQVVMEIGKTVFTEG